MITREFDAAREMVFEAWTQPEQLVRWWGPRGFTTMIHEMEARPGGVWRLTMRGPTDAITRTESFLSKS